MPYDYDYDYYYYNQYKDISYMRKSGFLDLVKYILINASTTNKKLINKIKILMVYMSRFFFLENKFME